VYDIRACACREAGYTDTHIPYTVDEVNDDSFAPSPSRPRESLDKEIPTSSVEVVTRCCTASYILRTFSRERKRNATRGTLFEQEAGLISPILSAFSNGLRKER